MGIAFIPDLSNLISSEVLLRGMPLNWVAWLTCMQLSLAALCICAVRMERTKSNVLILYSTAGWFGLQALDELIAGNFFGLGTLIEYAIAAAYVGTLTYYLKRHDRSANA